MKSWSARRRRGVFVCWQDRIEGHKDTSGTAPELS